MDEIRVRTGGRSFVREKPSIFVSSVPPSAVELAWKLSLEPLALGASAVEVLQCEPWWIVRADFDWLAGEGEEDRFNKLQAFPEAGVNDVRFAVVVAAFAQVLLVADVAEGVQTILGDPSDYPEIPEEKLATEKWPKAVAFALGQDAP